jgi:hypothetical protein
MRAECNKTMTFNQSGVLLKLNLPFLGQANKVVRNWHFGFASIPVFE